MPISPTSTLTDADLAELGRSWIDHDHATRAKLQRVDSIDGQAIVGQPKKDCAGIVFPIVQPGQTRSHGSILRRDNPEIVYEGEVRKTKEKYLCPPGGSNRLWFMPGTPAEWMKDPSIPLVFTEGAKKGIALERLSRHELGDAADKPRFLAVSIQGVWNWRGTTGKEINANGQRVDVKGPINDLDWLDFKGRRVVICFDSDAATNEKVQWAQKKFAEELRSRGADAHIAAIPQRGEKLGIDDFLFQYGPKEALEIIDNAKLWEVSPEQERAQTKALTALMERADLFQTTEGKLFATIEIKGVAETMPIRSSRFRTFITGNYYREHKTPISDGKLKEMINLCEARAEHEGDVHEVAFRIAYQNDRIYLDIGDEEHNTVEISGEGWRMVVNPPVRFRRAKSMGKLPWPIKGSDLSALRPFLNAEPDDVWIPMVSWLVGAFHPSGPYPILLLGGGEGCAKTTQMSVLRSLIDPTTKNTDKRSMPQSERDLVIAAINARVVSYDNLSDGLLPWMSDAFCRISTGGTFATRALYQDDEEVLFTFCRPVILNGIDEIASRADLVSRALTVSLKPIPETGRMDIATFEANFDEMRGRILGALLDAVSGALRMRGKVKLAKLPRMADFTLWVAGAAEAGTLPFTLDEFLGTYEAQKAAATSVLFEGLVIGKQLREFARDRPSGWTGSATDLLSILDNRNPGESIKNRAWPKSPSALARVLNRDQTTLLAHGVKLDFGKAGHKRERTITVQYEVEGDK